MHLWEGIFILIRKTLNKVGLILMLICGAAYWVIFIYYKVFDSRI